jgi:Protein of unknown function (DUF2855)
MPEFQVRKDNFVKHRIVAGEPADAPLAEGQVRVAIERFAYTANNVTYAATGDRLGYWQFFPPSGDDTDGWGVIPVWGVAAVVASEADGIAVGERLFGYWPPAAVLVMTPVNVSAQRFVDGAPHRAKLPPGYNNYQRLDAEPGYDRRSDELRMLLWPLHITSFCLWDALADRDWHGARQVLVLSASSKTSIGLACAIADDTTAPPAIGITSARNREFVEQLGLYAETVGYEELDRIDVSIPTVIVDMSGNADVLSALHTKLGDNMRHCSNVGLTHWGDTGSSSGMIKERSEFFFAPAHIQKRYKDWGPDGFAERTASFIRGTAAQSRDWLTIRRLDGIAGLAAVHEDVCNGRVDAREGLIVEL